MKTNYHTHCTFCDGKESARDMVKKAIEKGFEVLGFSSHSMFPFSTDWHVKPENHLAYCNEIRSLAKEFEGKIKIQLGFEADYVRGLCTPRFDRYSDFSPDFLIGSVHFITGDGGFTEADDSSQENVRAGIKDFFKDNIKDWVHIYFLLEKEMLEKGDFTFLGHPDLIRKQNNPKYNTPLFDENATWYREELRELAKACKKAGICVEINMGGMARGYLNTPYPSLELLSLLQEQNVPVTVNSDAHQSEYLDFAFDFALEYAKKAGYTELCFVKEGHFQFQKIDLFRT